MNWHVGDQEPVSRGPWEIRNLSEINTALKIGSGDIGHDFQALVQCPVP